MCARGCSPRQFDGEAFGKAPGGIPGFAPHSGCGGAHNLEMFEFHSPQNGPSEKDRSCPLARDDQQLCLSVRADLTRTRRRTRRPGGESRADDARHVLVRKRGSGLDRGGHAVRAQRSSRPVIGPRAARPSRHQRAGRSATGVYVILSDPRTSPRTETHRGRQGTRCGDARSSASAVPLHGPRNSLPLCGVAGAPGSRGASWVAVAGCGGC